MFFWFSSDGRRRNWGCGGAWFLLPLGALFLFAEARSFSTLLVLAIVVIFAVLIVPRLPRLPEENEKRKNDDLRYDKPKRDDSRYVLIDDGEIIEADNEGQSTTDRL